MKKVSKQVGTLGGINSLQNKFTLMLLFVRIYRLTEGSEVRDVNPVQDDPFYMWLGILK